MTYTNIEKTLKKLREPFDCKVYAIPYAGDLFEKQTRDLLYQKHSLLLKAVREMSHLIDEEITIQDGGFVNESDAKEYANTGYDMEVIKSHITTIINSVFNQE